MIIVINCFLFGIFSIVLELRRMILFHYYWMAHIWNRF